MSESGLEVDAVSVPVTTGLEVHWDADALSLSDDDEVTSFTDQSGNGHHATGAGPTFKTNMLNGRPVVRFDGVDDYFSTAHDPALQIAQPTVFAVMRHFNPVGGWNALICYPHSDPSESPWMRWAINTDGGSTTNQTAEIQLRWDGSSSNSDSLPVSWFAEWGIWRLHDAAVYRDADPLASNSGDISYPNDVGIFLGATVGGSNSAEIDVAEVLVYDHLLSSQEVDDVETYLGGKWLGLPTAEGRFALSGGLYAPAYLKGGAKVPVYAKGGLKLP